MNTTDFPTQVKAWLKDEGKSTQWLAEQCGAKISVVYSWFSTRGFPSEQRLRIESMMKESDSASMIRIPFTDSQLNRTQKAANIVGAEFQEYCQKAISEQVRHDLETDILKVAEDPNI